MIYSNKNLPQDCQNRIATILEQDENLLWCGQPAMKLFHWTDCFLIPYSLFLGWATYALASLFFMPGMSIIRADQPLLFVFILTVVCAFALMTAYLTVGRFIYYYWRKKCTFYALSNKRVIILSTFLRRSVQSATLKDLQGIRRLTNDSASGSIIFGKCTPYQLTALERLGSRCLYTPFVPTSSLIVFFDIDDVGHVYDKIENARAHFSNPAEAKTASGWRSKTENTKIAFPVDERIKKAFRNCLEQDESILWGAQPTFRLWVWIAPVFLIICVGACVFTCEWLSVGPSTHMSLPTFIMLHVVIVTTFIFFGAGLCIYQWKNTYYAVTNKRVITFMPYPFGGFFARELDKIHVVNNIKIMGTQEISFRPLSNNWFLHYYRAHAAVADREPVFYLVENSTDVVNLVNALRMQVQTAMPKQSSQDDSKLLLQYRTPRKLPAALILQELFCGHNAVWAWLPVFIALIIGFIPLRMGSIPADWPGILISFGAGAQTDASVMGNLENGELWKGEYFYKVRYTSASGKKSIAQIYTNEKLKKGKTIKIKYLPKVPTEAFPVDQKHASCNLYNQVVLFQFGLITLLIISAPGLILLVMHLVGSLKALSLVPEGRVAVARFTDDERSIYSVPIIVQREYEYIVAGRVYKTYSFVNPSQLPNKEPLVLYDPEAPSRSAILSDMAGQPELLPDGSIQLKQPMGWRIVFILIPAILAGTVCWLLFWLFSYIP